MTTESFAPRNASDTLDAVSDTRRQQPARRGYVALWRGVPRELGFLVLTMPIAYVAFSLLNGILWAGVGTLIVYIGVFLVAGSLYIARAFGTLELVRLRWSGQPEIARPDWNPDGKPITFWRGVFGPYANGHYWLYLLHAMVINPIISMISWVFTIVWVSVGLGGITYWFWDRFVPHPDHETEGVRAAIRLRSEHPGVGVLLLSQYVEGTYAQELLSAGDGGVGYLLKDRVASLDELQDAITRVAEGGTVLDPQVVRELLVRRTDPLESLTPRETEVLQLMAEGRTNAGIASRLVIGVGAVEKNVTAIFQKLGLEDSGTDHRRVLAVLAFLQR